MKNSRRIFSIVLTLAVVLSLAAITASAANTTDEEFYGFEIWIDGRHLYPREKDDATPHYLYVTDGNISTMRVMSTGSETYVDYNYGENTTTSNGRVVNNVVCQRGTRYSIHNIVYEEGYPWASLHISRFNDWAGGVITGVWSPDSRYTYTSATP